jgi:CspA family cold shock protein
MTIQTGKVKWFNWNKGYGFIAPNDGSKDVFIHITAVKDADIKAMEEGQELEFELQEHNGKASAINLKEK